MFTTPFRLLVLWLLSAAGLFAAPWQKLTTPHAIIYSDASPQDLLRFGVGYTAYQQVFHQLFSPPLRAPKATLVLFRRVQDMERYVHEGRVDRERVASSATVDRMPLVGLSVDGDHEKALEDAMQFTTLWQLERTGFDVPLWVAQGAGQVLDSLSIEKDRAFVGGFSPYYEAWRDHPIPWPRFFQINTADPEYQGRVEGSFHAQAWALMHRVLLDGDGTATFHRLASNLQQMDGLAAVEATLGMPIRQLEGDILRSFRGKSVGRSFAIDRHAIQRELSPTPATDQEVHAHLALLALACRRTKQADAELAKLGSAGDELPIVKEIQARLALRAKDVDAAVTLYRAAIRLGSTNPVAFLRSAEQTLRDLGEEPGGGGKPAEEALAEIRHALRLDPTNYDAYRLLGRALIVIPAIAESDVAALTPAVGRGHAGQRIRFLRALAWHRLDRREAYMDDLQQVLNDPKAGAELRRAAATRLDDAEIEPVEKEVKRLIAAGDPAAAQQVLANASRRLSPALQPRLAALRTWVDSRQSGADGEAQ